MYANRKLNRFVGLSPEPNYNDSLLVPQKKEDLKKIMKLAYLQLKQEMNDLNCANGNISSFPCRFSPCRKSPEEKCDTEYLHINNLSNSSKKNSLSIERQYYEDYKEILEEEPVSHLKSFLRNYDIERIKQERVLHSFTIGRKIRRAENTDRKINQEIENDIMGLCPRKSEYYISLPESKPKINKRKKSRLLNHLSPPAQRDNKVFDSIYLTKRTDDMYKNFAKTTLEGDIIKENRAHKKGGTLNTKIVSFQKESPKATLTMRNTDLHKRNFSSLNTQEITEVSHESKKQKMSDKKRVRRIKRDYKIGKIKKKEDNSEELAAILEKLQGFKLIRKDAHEFVSSTIMRNNRNKTNSMKNPKLKLDFDSRVKRFKSPPPKKDKFHFPSITNRTNGRSGCKSPGVTAKELNL
ncbi:unnamed protein product [Moneuplotes crassus]|uniref:Uncharacterized protein n=1 Tax=Euplotes crassus TaxID=5936 RepID=A0AAD2D8E9_EUPCR|nr:unnamed protein product [Moneuplotes crassus]